MTELLTNQPVVIDNGSGVIKAGFAGDEQPRCIFPAYVGKVKYKRVMAGAFTSSTKTTPTVASSSTSTTSTPTTSTTSTTSKLADYIVGKEAEEHRGLLKLHHPLTHSTVTDWNLLQLLWSHAFSQLNTSPEEHAVLVTEAAQSASWHREKMAQVLFEHFNVPALFVSTQSVLSLYASGRTTGVVLDSGEGVTHAVPVYEGFALPHAIMRIDVAGRDVTSHLQLQLRRAGYNFHTSAEREVIRAMKESVCYVARDPHQEELNYLLYSTSSPNNPNLNTGRNIEAVYLLPDGNSVVVGPERFRAPEILFHPDIIGEEYIGIHECIVHSINRTDIDMRKILYANIVLAGGSTLFPGFGERLLSEVKSQAPKGIKIKISAPPERKYSTWIGGSILANLPTFKNMWVSRRDYEEEGAQIIHNKTF